MTKAKNRSPLKPQQVVDLLQLALNTYYDQSEKSLDAGAPLASCIMIGATLEAILTAVVGWLYEEALETGKAPKKDLLKWDLGELLTVAKAANWLPGELQLDPRLDPRGMGTVPTDTIRQVRNFVHPARFFRERARDPYTAEEVRVLYATCHAACDCVINLMRARYPNLPCFRSF